MTDTTAERILETREITDNIWLDVANGEITAEQATELIDSILKG